MKKVKVVHISHWCDSDENADQVDCEIACDCVKRANVVEGLRKDIIARTHTATHKPTSAQRLIVTTMTHTWWLSVELLGLPRDGQQNLICKAQYESAVLNAKKFCALMQQAN